MGKDVFLSASPLFAQPGQLIIYRSADRGDHWDALPPLLSANEALVPMLVGHLAVDDDNSTIYIPILQAQGIGSPGGIPGTISVLSSHDRGQTWQRHVVVDAPSLLSYPPTLAKADGDAIAIAFVTREGAEDLLRMSLSRDDGNTWEPAATLVSEPSGGPLVGLSNGAYDTPCLDAGDGDLLLLFGGNSTLVAAAGETKSLIIATIPILSPRGAPAIAEATIVARDTGYEFASLHHDDQGRIYAVATTAGRLVFMGR